MALAMTRPTKRDDCSALQFRRRTPTPLAAKKGEATYVLTSLRRVQILRREPMDYADSIQCASDNRREDHMTSTKFILAIAATLTLFASSTMENAAARKGGSGPTGGSKQFSQPQQFNRQPQQFNKQLGQAKQFNTTGKPQTSNPKPPKTAVAKERKPKNNAAGKSCVNNHRSCTSGCQREHGHPMSRDRCTTHCLDRLSSCLEKAHGK